MLRQAAELATAMKINLTFRIDDTRLHVTLDPKDLSENPERKRPARRPLTRAVGLDLKPGWIGMTPLRTAAIRANLASLQQAKFLLERRGRALICFC
ncbi:hypothetical protein QA641_16320 [Bradyrhizobium sp. CB1650]|uniref:hypothetical protein n=1 Tax=Bradyrhizobium sp. CB1650 TaxID=3039153 RepID=UPI002435B82C|nr:hypothetical protein [Bradyrhizobium sp. CB1650]WGD55297.1 hypothetical protein QA641_16320 [Bradyrhizobium sp. CB1650]